MLSEVPVLFLDVEAHRQHDSWALTSSPASQAMNSRLFSVKKFLFRHILQGREERGSLAVRHVIMRLYSQPPVTFCGERVISTLCLDNITHA